MPHTLKQEAFVITIEKTWFQYTKVHDTLCVVQMSMSYCCCHHFFHNSQLRNTHSGAAQNENSKSGIVGGNAELALRRCLIFDQTICYSAQAATSLLKPRVCVHCLQDRSSPDLCIILALLALYFEGVHRPGEISRSGFFPPTCSSFICVPLKSRTSPMSTNWNAWNSIWA